MNVPQMQALADTAVSSKAGPQALTSLLLRAAQVRALEAAQEHRKLPQDAA